MIEKEVVSWTAEAVPGGFIARCDSMPIFVEGRDASDLGKKIIDAYECHTGLRCDFSVQFSSGGFQILLEREREKIN